MRAWAVAGVVLATAGLGVALGAGAPGDRSLGAYAYLLFVAALLVLAAMKRTRALPAADDATLLAAAPARRKDHPTQLAELVRTLSMSRITTLDVHYRLRPLARTIAAARLAQRHGVELDRDPERARRILADGPLWELVRPDRREPADRQGRGFRVAELARVVDELERI